MQDFHSILVAPSFFSYISKIWGLMSNNLVCVSKMHEINYWAKSHQGLRKRTFFDERLTVVNTSVVINLVYHATYVAKGFEYSWINIPPEISNRRSKIIVLSWNTYCIINPWAHSHFPYQASCTECVTLEMDFSFPCRRPPGNFLYFCNPDEKLLITGVCGRQQGRWHERQLGGRGS